MHRPHGPEPETSLGSGTHQGLHPLRMGADQILADNHQVTNESWPDVLDKQEFASNTRL